jgi:hypothetical protein
VLLRHLVADSRKLVVKSAYGSKLKKNLRSDLKKPMRIPISDGLEGLPIEPGVAGGIIDS